MCGAAERVENHHPDYDKPRVFVRLCRDCHNDLHSVERETLFQARIAAQPKYVPPVYTLPQDVVEFITALASTPDTVAEQCVDLVLWLRQAKKTSKRAVLTAAFGALIDARTARTAA